MSGPCHCAICSMDSMGKAHDEDVRIGPAGRCLSHNISPAVHMLAPEILVDDSSNASSNDATEDVHCIAGNRHVDRVINMRNIVRMAAG